MTSQKNLVEKFTALVAMQVNLNEQVVSHWYEKGLDWQAAILDECNECQSSIHWKWWKTNPFEDGEADISNLKVEAVDLLHFLISASLERALTRTVKMDDAVAAVGCSLANTYADINEGRVEPELKFITIIKEIALCSLSSQYPQALVWLFRLFAILGMTEKEIVNRFIAKNILNSYRSERGYNNPEIDYPKIHKGLEDNQHLEIIMQRYSGGFESIERIRNYIFNEMDAVLQG